MRIFSALLVLFLWAAASAAATFVVTKETDDDGTCTPDDCALREAVQAANDLPGADIIEIPGGTYQLSLVGTVPENFNQTGDLDIQDDVEIHGAGQEEVMIIGDGLDRVMDISNNSVVEVSNVTITGGGGSTGAGLRVQGRDFLLRNSIVTGNSSATGSGIGGGIFIGVGNARIESSTIYGNSAPQFQGGGIYASIQTSFRRFELVNSTISGNDAFIGGGLYLFGSGFIDIRHSTITGNTASVTFSDGLVGDLTTNLSFFNSLIADDSCRYLGGNPTSNGFNIEGPFDSCFISAFGDQVAVPDALLAPLGDYGGPTPTHALLPGSPAVDAALDADCPAVDQRGENRPVDGDLDGTATCDVGAYEAAAALPATTEIPTLSEIGSALLAAALAFTAVAFLRRAA